MTRHEPLSVQTAIPPSRPAEDRAPLDGRAVMAPVPGLICPSKHPLIGLFIAPSAPAASPPHLLSTVPKLARSRNTHSS